MSISSDLLKSVLGINLDMCPGGADCPHKLGEVPRPPDPHAQVLFMFRPVGPPVFSVRAAQAVRETIKHPEGMVDTAPFDSMLHGDALPPESAHDSEALGWAECANAGGG